MTHNAAEINRFLAEQLMGWVLCRVTGDMGWDWDEWVSPTEGIMYSVEDWHPFASPALAVEEVIPAMKAKNCECETYYDGKWYVAFWLVVNDGEETVLAGQAKHETLAGAVCMAAAAALSQENKT